MLGGSHETSPVGMIRRMRVASMGLLGGVLPGAGNGRLSARCQTGCARRVWSPFLIGEFGVTGGKAMAFERDGRPLFSGVA